MKTEKEIRDRVDKIDSKIEWLDLRLAEMTFNLHELEFDEIYKDKLILVKEKKGLLWVLGDKDE